MVKSAYLFSSSNAFVTSSIVVPLLAVLDRIVCTASILVSYSEKPVLMGSNVNAETIRFPALTAWLVMLVRAVMPITWRELNLSLTVSIASPIQPMFTLLAAVSIASKPLAAPSKFKLCFNFSSVLKLVWTFSSKFRLSNCISTTLESTVVLIA